jgi:hypothetical protein
LPDARGRGRWEGWCFLTLKREVALPAKQYVPTVENELSEILFQRKEPTENLRVGRKLAVSRHFLSDGCKLGETVVFRAEDNRIW